MAKVIKNSKSIITNFIDRWYKITIEVYMYVFTYVYIYLYYLYIFISYINIDM